MRGRLTIDARGVDKILSAREYVRWNYDFMKTFAGETPWMSPFSVCGKTPRHSNIKIKEDFSNFEEMSNLALSDYKNDRFRNVGRKECRDLLPTSYSHPGFRLSYIDGYKRRAMGQRCLITIESPSFLEGYGSLRDISIELPSLNANEMTSSWLKQDEVGRIISLLVDAFTHCVSVVFSSKKLFRASLEGNLNFSSDAYKLGGPPIGPITYFGNPRVVEVLKNEPDMQPFGKGLLLRLTDDIAGAERLAIVQRLHAINVKLRDAKIETLEDGINRADWGCDSSSVLQGEPEVWPEHRRD